MLCVVLILWILVFTLSLVSDAPTSSKMVLHFTTQTQYQVQSSFLQDVVVRLCPVIVHSICIPNSCIFLIAKTGLLRCCLYILWWRTGADGQQEAKARLVHQGFRDPDALAGRLETKSPPASWLVRQALLTIDATEDWQIAVAEVQTAFSPKYGKGTGLVHRVARTRRSTAGQCWTLPTYRT